MRRVWFALGLVYALAAGQVMAACPNPAILGSDPPGRQLTDAGRRAVLAEVDDLVRARALDPSFGGHDWQAAFAHTRGAALAAPDEAGFYRALRDLTVRLRDGHLAFLSPADVAEQDRVAGDDLASSTHGQIGLITEGLEGGQLRVQAVSPGSPAARAGLRPGDLILRVNGQCPREVGGAVGSAVQLLVQGASGPARTLRLVRAPTPAEPFIQTARLRADARIGYLRFDSFEPDQIGAQLQSALYLLTQAGPLRGLVVDLRSNGGGQLYEVQRFLGIFVEGTVGQYRDRAGGWTPLDTVHTVGEAVDRLRGVPVAVLVSAYTRSGGEVAAAVLRGSRGARVLGQRTPGLTSVASLFPLPDGSELQLPVADLYVNGQRLSASGVVPDVTLPDTPIQEPSADAVVRRAMQELAQMRR